MFNFNPSQEIDPLTSYRQVNGMQIPPIDSQRLGMGLPIGSQISMDNQQQNPEIQHISDVITQYTQNKADQASSNTFLTGILSNRKSPETVDTTRSILNSALTGSYSSPEIEMAQRYKAELSPYTDTAKLQGLSTEAQGGATGALVNRIMQVNGGDLMGALQYLKGGANQGTTMNNGVITAIPGAATAKGEINRGAQTGTNAANLAFAAPIAIAKETGTATGEAIGKAQTSLPQAQDTALYMKNLVEGLTNDEAMPTSVGAFSYLPVVRGSKRADFMNRLSQTQSGAFLQAFNNLRGGGQISNAEGEKATAALNRMNTSTSPDEFKKAGNDFLTIIDQALQRTRNAASGSLTPATDGQTPEQFDPLGIR